MRKIAKRYKLLRQLGRGSVGEVFLVEDTREGRELCLKLLNTPDPEFESDLSEEFVLLTGLRHPGLIAVYDYGIDPEEGHYFTMEYAARGDLSAAIPLDASRFFEACETICPALDYIHNRGIIHGDLKPSNILVDSRGDYKIADFGLSSIFGKAVSDSSSGTAAFVAPEVLRKGSLSPKSDIYSLGLLFYEMITGRPLYAGSAGEIIGRKLSGGIPPLDVPGEFGGPEMNTILSTMLNPSPGRRYKSVGEVLDRIRSLNPSGARPPAQPSPLPETGAFVGRESQIAMFESGFECYRSEGRLLFIGGEPGVGKSRLVDEFRIRSQTAGAGFYRTFCREGTLRPFAPLLKILGYVFAELDPEMGKFSSYGPDLKRLFPERYENEVSGSWHQGEADFRSSRRRLFDNLLRYLDELAADHRIILAIEDLQWADNDTLEFLEFFHANPAMARNTFIICTARMSPGTKLPSFLTSVHMDYSILGPIERESWPAFLSGFLGKSSFPDSFGQRLYEETGGNFLMTEELIKELASQRCLVKRAGQWFVTEGWEEKIGIPGGITPLLERRLHELSVSEQEFAAIAAILGRSFIDDELLQLTGNAERHELVEGLIRRGILRKALFGGRERVDFVHLQMRRSAERLLSPAETERWHLRIAEFFESRNEDEEFLGRHYFSGNELRKGFDYLFAAAEKAERLYSYKQASDLYKTAMRCLEGRPGSPDLAARLYDVKLGAGRALDFISPPEASQYLIDAAELAAQYPDGRGTEALVAAGNNSQHLGQNDMAIKYLKEGLARSGRFGQVRTKGEAFVGLGFVYDKIGKLDDAEEAYLNALELFSEIDFPEGSCRVLNYLGIARKRRGDLEGAEDFYRRALSICIEKGFKWSAMNLYGNLGNIYSTKGDFTKAEENYRLSLDISREISDRRIESVNLLNIGHALNQMGKIEQAEKEFFEAAEKQRSLGDKSSEAITMNNLGFLYYKKGEIRNSLEYYQKGFDMSLEIDQPRVELANLIGIIEDRVSLADYYDLIPLSEQAINLAREINDVEQLAVTLTLKAEIASESGDLDAAAKCLREFLSMSSELGEPRQRLKALLTAGHRCPEGEFDRGALSKQIDKIIASYPHLKSMETRFKAESALIGKDDGSGREIWIARLTDAVRRAGEAGLFSEEIRLLALKIRMLESSGEDAEASRVKTVLEEKLESYTMGLDRKFKDNFRRCLNIDAAVKGLEDIKMGSTNREERLEVLFRVARTINTIRESDPLLNKIMDLAIETLNAERGFIMLYSPAEDTGRGERMLEPVAARNLEREDIFGEKTISRSSAMEVAESGKPLLIRRADDEISARQSVVDFRISSVLCVPLAVKGRILGIVYVDSRSGAIFDDDDLEFLVSFADLAAIAIENARLAEKLRERTLYLQKQVESRWDFGNIVGRSSPMQRVFRMAESVCDSEVNVVISGESGTGKELLAKAIHFAGRRKNARFLPVDCGALTETLLESELFGHVKGAFTGADSDKPGLFEVAEKGTIFLDEITNTSPNFQVKLLRVLQENEIRRVGDTKSRKIEVRVIAATNKNLENEVGAGKFREDLYYRLNVVNIHIPSLKERREDIGLLAGYFLEKICSKMNISRKAFSAEALDCLTLYSWPGNVRQLENVCERAVIFTPDDTIGPEQLPAEIKTARIPGRPDSPTAIPTTKSELKAAKAEIDRLFVERLLRSTRGNVMKAAAMSGMDRSQLHQMLNKYRLDASDFKKTE